MAKGHLGTHHGKMRRGALVQFRRGVANGTGRAQWHGFRAGPPDRCAVGGDAELGVRCWGRAMGVAVRGPDLRLLKLSAPISQPASLPMRTAHLGAHLWKIRRVRWASFAGAWRTAPGALRGTGSELGPQTATRSGVTLNLELGFGERAMGVAVRGPDLRSPKDCIWWTKWS